jgi:DNA-binding MarR family transcriptional regulator
VNAQRDTEATPQAPAVNEAVWCSLRHIHLAVSRGLDAELQATHRLLLGEYELLRALASPGCAQRMAGLAMVVGLSPSGLTRAIERLERRGLVRRLPCPVDRRGASAVLSEAGLDLLQRATATHETALHTLLLEAMTPADGDLLLRLRERVVGSPADDCPPGTALPPSLQGARATGTRGTGSTTSSDTSKENP